MSWKARSSDPKIETFLDELRASRRIEEPSHSPQSTDLEKASLALLDIGTRPERAKVRDNPGATQIYLDQVQKKTDLAFDFDCRAKRPQTSEEIRQVQNALQRTYDKFVSYTTMPPNKDTRDSCLDQWNFCKCNWTRLGPMIVQMT